MYEGALSALGTNGKPGSSQPSESPSLPTGPLGPGDLDRIRGQFSCDASGRCVRRSEVEAQERREGERETRRAEWLERMRQRGEHCEQHPEECAAAAVPLCAFVRLLPGAIIGAIASPKGERGGGAKWGALASAAICPIGIATVRLGVFGSLINWSLGIAAPIMAARYRLKRKRERRLTS